MTFPRCTLALLISVVSAVADAQIKAISLSPPPGATGVSRRPVIEVALNGDIHPDICKGSTLHASGLGGGANPPSFSVVCEGRKIRFQAQSELEPMKQYELVLTVPIGYDGSSVQPIYGWTITTGSSSVTIGKLEIVSMKPAPGSAVAPSPAGELRPVIELHFNHPIDVTRCAAFQQQMISVRDRSGNADTGEWKHTCHSKMVTAAITWRSHLKPGRQYDVSIAPGVLVGSAGEVFAPPPPYTFRTTGTFQHDTMSDFDRKANEAMANMPAAAAAAGLKTIPQANAPAALAVTSTDPAGGATEAPVDGDVIVTFNQDVHCQALSHATAAIFVGDAQLSSRLECKDGGKIHLNPEGELEPGQRYRIRITQGLIGRGGAALAQEFEAEFTTTTTPPPPAKRRKKGGLAKRLAKNVARVAKSVAKGVAQGVQTVAKGVAQVAKGVVQLAKAPVTLVARGSGAAGRAAKEGVRNVGRGLGKIAKGALDVLTLGQKEKILEAIRKLLSSKLLDVVKGAAGKLLGKLPGLSPGAALQKAPAALTVVLGNGERLVSLVGNPRDYLQRGREWALNQLTTLAMKLGEAAVRKLAGGLMAQLVSAAKHLVTAPLTVAVSSAVASLTLGIGAAAAPLVKLGIDQFFDWAMERLEEPLGRFALGLGALRTFVQQRFVRGAVAKVYDKVEKLLRAKAPALAGKPPAAATPARELAAELAREKARSPVSLPRVVPAPLPPARVLATLTAAAKAAIAVTPARSSSQPTLVVPRRGSGAAGVRSALGAAYSLLLEDWRSGLTAAAGLERSLAGGFDGDAAAELRARLGAYRAALHTAFRLLYTVRVLQLPASYAKGVEGRSAKVGAALSRRNAGAYGVLASGVAPPDELGAPFGSLRDALRRLAQGGERFLRGAQAVLDAGRAATVQRALGTFASQVTKARAALEELALTAARAVAPADESDDAPVDGEED